MRKGKPGYWLGKPQTEESNEKRSKKMMGNTFRLGIPNTEEAIAKIRESLKGNTNALGCHWTEVAKKKKSKKMMGNTNSLGEKNPNWGKFGPESSGWIDGRSFEPYPPEWTPTLCESIRQRDGYRCQLCGVLQREYFLKLGVHHIDYNKENLDPMNLITLCNRCNTKVNSNREVWMRYFRKKMEKKLAEVQL